MWPFMGQNIEIQYLSFHLVEFEVINQNFSLLGFFFLFAKPIIVHCETYWKCNDRLELSTVLEIIYDPETGHIIHYSLPLVY